MRKTTMMAALMGCALMLLTLGCGTFGDVFGGGGDDGDGGTAPGVVADLRGEVVRVDTRTREIEIDTRSYATNLRSGADRIMVGYTDDTRVIYQGREYRPEDLDPGDLVRVEIDDRAGRNVAARIEVEKSVQERGGTGGTIADSVLGEVERIDTQARQLAVDTGRETVWIAYDERVPVYYQGREYQVANLEPGDTVEIRVDRDSRGGLVARAVTVTRSVQEGSSGGYPSTDMRTYDGTVTWLDDRASEFGLDLGRGDVVRVTLPYNATGSLRTDFERLRRGDRITVEAVPRGTDSIELVRFR